MQKNQDLKVRSINPIATSIAKNSILNPATKIGIAAVIDTLNDSASVVYALSGEDDNVQLQSQYELENEDYKEWKKTSNLDVLFQALANKAFTEKLVFVE